MLKSGTPMETTSFIRNNAGALIPPGTRSMIVALVRSSPPEIYLCETHEDNGFEQEEFFCFIDQMKLADGVV